MANVLDIRSSTCKGGGALWSFLSHIREVPLGGTLELLTDDPIAPRDIPEWAAWEGWSIEHVDRTADFTRFVLRRPSEPHAAHGRNLPQGVAAG